MDSMLEAARFYRECIGDVMKSVVAEIHSDNNDLCNFNALLFHNISMAEDQMCISFILNQEEIKITVPVGNKLDDRSIIERCREHIAKHLTGHIIGILKRTDWRKTNGNKKTR